MQFCPNCGVPVQSTVETQKTYDNNVFTEEKPTKKNHVGIAVLLIILAILVAAGAFYVANDTAKNKTYNQFAELYNTMAKGAVKAETANILIIDVWRNSIIKTEDAKTDKFTKENEGNGQFYDDFNDALRSLYADQTFIEDLTEIYSLQSKAETQIKNLSKHKRAFDEEYSDFKDCYNVFVKFTNMSLDAKGSLNSFRDDHNELDGKLADKLKELDIYFD